MHSFNHHIIIVKTVGKFVTKHLLKPVGGREVERYFIPKPQVENNYKGASGLIGGKKKLSTLHAERL